MENTERPMVSIQCWVYNQEKFLRQCLDGFVMQKTNFPFEAVVHDDASTDKSADIIREYAEKYPHIIKPIFEAENQYSKHDGSLRRIMLEACTGKYLAICEGDDYWIDPLKLQKQVDYMESHPDVTMCFTDFDYYYQKSGKLIKSILKTYPKTHPHKYTVESWILAKAYLGPMTWLYKSESKRHVPNLEGADGSFVWVTYFLAEGKIHCLLNDTTAVYRISNAGVSHPGHIKDVYERSWGLLQLQLKLADFYVKKDSFKYVILKEWVNSGNVKLAFVCDDKKGKELIKENFKCLSFKNKLIYTMLKIFPSFTRKMFKRRMMVKDGMKE